MKAPLIIALWLLLLQAAKGQLLESDTAKWQYGASSALSLSKGNVERALWKSDAYIKHAHRRWGFSSNTSYLYGTFGDFLTENDWLSRSFLYYSPKSRLYPYLMGWAESSRRRRINRRIIAGAGATFVAARSDKHLVKASFTAAYADELYDGTAFSNSWSQERATMARGIARIFGQHRLGHLQLQYEWWHQRSFNKAFPNHLNHLNAAILYPIAQGLSIQTQLNYTRESVYLAQVKPFDLFWTVGLSFKRIKP